MRIALVCHARHPIGPPFAGGLEAHNWHLARALRRHGHNVTVFASGDSDPDLQIDPIVPVHVEATHVGLEHRDDAALHAYGDQAYRAACERINNGSYDIVHNHSLHRFVPLAARDAGWAAVTTLHTPPLGGLDWFIRHSLSPRHRVSAATHAQRALWWPGDPPEHSTVIANGIGLDEWPFEPAGNGTAIWCGRLSPEKGPHMAIDAARKAGVAVALAGPIEDPAFFRDEIAPRLGGDANYIGALEPDALARRLGAASVFLSTPCWPEPFGLAAIEAMACGLPVAAFDCGAVREVVGENSGRYAAPNDVEALAAAILAAMRLDRNAARARVERRFGIERMVNGYEDLYRAVLAA